MRTSASNRPSSLAYFDAFWLFAVLAVVLIPLVFLMKPLGGREGRPHRRRVDPLESAIDAGSLAGFRAQFLSPGRRLNADNSSYAVRSLHADRNRSAKW